MLFDQKLHIFMVILWFSLYFLKEYPKSFLVQLSILGALYSVLVIFPSKVRSIFAIIICLVSALTLFDQNLQIFTVILWLSLYFLKEYPKSLLVPLSILGALYSVLVIFPSKVRSFLR